jgi:hypothetical protein
MSGSAIPSRPWFARWAAVGALPLARAGCGDFSESATRLAFDLRAGAARLGQQPGDRYTLVHKTPSRAGQCEGPYTVQLDKVGAIIMWCRNAAGATVESHSTSASADAVEMPKTYILDKPAHAPLTIVLERRGNRAVIADVE